MPQSYIWVLIEQQRDPDVWLLLRQFCYIGIIWDHPEKRSCHLLQSCSIFSFVKCSTS